MEVVSEAPISVRVSEDTGADRGGFSVQLSFVHDSSHVQHYREFLPPSIKTRNISFAFDCSTQNRIVIKSARFMVADMLAFDLTAEDICSGYDFSDGMAVSKGLNNAIIVDLKNGSGTLTPKSNASQIGHWAGISPTGIVLPRWIAKAIFCFVVFLMVLSFISSFYVSKNISHNNRVVVISFLLAILASAFISVYLPMQSFFSNSANYSFSSVELFVSQVRTLFLVGTILFCGLFLSYSAFSWFPHCVILIFIVYEYFQTGVLSLGAPTMNGDMSYYSNNLLAIRDACVLGIVVLAIAVLHRFIIKRMERVAAVVSIVLGISLISSFCMAEKPVNHQPTKSGYCSKLAVLESLEFTKRNVIVLVLDSITTEVAADIFSSCPELAAHFAGFTVFANNIGMHHETDYATIGIMTGEYYTNNVETVEKERYLNSVWGVDSVLHRYLSFGDNVNFISPAYYFGLSSYGERLTHELVSDEKTVLPINQSGGESLSFSLRDLCLFRLVPFVGKRQIFTLLYASTSSHGRIDDEEAVYPLLRVARSSDSEKTTFLFVHTHGAHCPHDIDRDGRHLCDGLYDGYGRFYDQTYFVFSRVGSLFDSWKERGIYDSSYILLIADHGSHGPNDTKSPDVRRGALPPRAHPFLCIKPFGAREVVNVDNVTPTDHAHLNKLLKALSVSDCSVEESVSMLSNTNRLFVIPTNNSSCQWKIDGRGMVTDYQEIAVGGK